MEKAEEEWGGRDFWCGWGGGRGLETDCGLSTTLAAVSPGLLASMADTHLHGHSISTAWVAGSPVPVVRQVRGTE